MTQLKYSNAKECGVDVTVNANYPITEVNCRDWYCPKKTNGTQHDGVEGVQFTALLNELQTNFPPTNPTPETSLEQIMYQSWSAVSLNT